MTPTIGIVETKYRARVAQTKSLLCVGLDSNFEALPGEFRARPMSQFAFNRWIIEQTHAYVSAYKPNIAFYEARGSQGWHELELTMQYLHENHPDIVTICDAKRADIGSTNAGYVSAIFDHLGFDAITLHPYLGAEALAPFLERDDKACIILCRTSNPGAGELQELNIGGKPLWQHVAETVATKWNERQNCMLVVGATAPTQLKTVREIVGDMTILVPGVGAQGGDVGEVMQNGCTTDGLGLMVNVARDVIFHENPGQSARKYVDLMNQSR